MRGTTQPTPAERAYATHLVEDNPSWSELLDGADWERAFDLLDKTKFVSAEEIASLVAALEAAVGTPARPTANLVLVDGVVRLVIA